MYDGADGCGNESGGGRFFLLNGVTPTAALPALLELGVASQPL